MNPLFNYKRRKRKKKKKEKGNFLSLQMVSYLHILATNGVQEFPVSIYSMIWKKKKMFSSCRKREGMVSPSHCFLYCNWKSTCQQKIFLAPMYTCFHAMWGERKWVYNLSLSCFFFLAHLENKNENDYPKIPKEKAHLQVVQIHGYTYNWFLKVQILSMTRKTTLKELIPN